MYYYIVVLENVAKFTGMHLVKLTAKLFPKKTKKKKRRESEYLRTIDRKLTLN